MDRRNYLLTGATGVVGSAVLPLLLADADSTVWALVRASSTEHLARREQGLLEFLGVPKNSPTARRLRLLRGDVAVPRLGLTDRDHASLGECTHVLHCAGNVRFDQSLLEARSTACGSVRNLLSMASEWPRLVKIDVVSTVGVAGRSLSALPETWVEEASYNNTYEQSKAEAELLLREEMSRGTPITVHRPSMVVGHAQTGASIRFQIFYYIADFLSGRATLGVVPRLGGARLDIVPSDYVARAIHWSMHSADTAGRILHLCSGPEASIELAYLKQRVAQSYVSRGKWVPRSVAVSPRVMRGIAKAGHPMAPKAVARSLRLIPELLNHLELGQSFTNQRTRELLSHAGIGLPKPRDYLGPVLSYYLDQRN